MRLFLCKYVSLFISPEKASSMTSSRHGARLGIKNNLLYSAFDLIYFIKTYFSLNLSEVICKRLSVTVSQISLSLLLTKINLRLPLSSAFNSKHACPVVPLPAKKSSISESHDVVARINSFISFSGFGVEKYSLFPNRLYIIQQIFIAVCK